MSKEPVSQKEPIPSQLIIDRDEYEAALRCIQMQSIARRLGCRLPYAKAKKFHCRCGEVFVHPNRFLSHRTECKILKRDKELLDRGPKEEVIVVAPVKRKHGFDCYCGVTFKSKGQRTKHQKLCFAYADRMAIIKRGKEYLERTGEPKKRRGKRDSNNKSRKKKKLRAKRPPRS